MPRGSIKSIRVIESPSGAIRQVKGKQGREVPGLRLHAPSGRYYINVGGKRKYLSRDLTTAVMEVEGIPQTPPETYERWETQGEVEDKIQDLSPDALRGILHQINAKLDPEAIAAQRHDGEYGIDLDPPDPVSKQRLSDCLKFWFDWKVAEAGAATDHIRFQRKLFERFIKCVGNLPINRITQKTFQKWQQHVTGSAKRNKWTVKTQRDHHSTVTRILSFVKRKNDDWAFPVGMIEWSRDWQEDLTTPYVAKEGNKSKMPPDVFNRYRQAAAEWENADPEQFESNTQRGRAQRRQAKLKQVHGIQADAILLLALHGLGNVDLCRIEWGNLHLDDQIPYFDFPRTKCEHKTGVPIDRITPLLPSCLESLKRLKKISTTSNVFTNGQGRAFNKDKLAALVKRLQGKGMEAWTLKHLRNAASTVAQENQLPQYVIDRVLGHTQKETSKFYMGAEFKPSDLVPLMNLVGGQYLDGESIELA